MTDFKVRLLILIILFCSCIAACFLFASCNTTKDINLGKTVVDSAAKKEVDRLTRILAEEKTKHEKELMELSTTGIIFKPLDPIQVTDTVYQPAKIIIDRSGTIQAEGRLQSVTMSNHRYLKEIDLLHRKADSMQTENEKLKTALNRKEKDKEVVKKSSLSWWLILAGILSILLNLFFIYRQFKKYYSLKKIIP